LGRFINHDWWSLTSRRCAVEAQFVAGYRSHSGVILSADLFTLRRNLRDPQPMPTYHFRHQNLLPVKSISR
jgi:hypothetical protein